MNRDWQISVVAAVACHFGLLYAFEATLRRPPRLPQNPMVEVTLVTAPAASAPAVVEAPKPVVPSTPPSPPVMVKAPEPKPVVKPPEPEVTLKEREPVIKPPEPVVQTPLPPPVVSKPEAAPAPRPVEAPAPPAPSPRQVAIAAPVAPAGPIIGDGNSIKPGQDLTTKQVQPGIRAKPNYRKNPELPYPPIARRRRQEGLVLLTIKVTAQGRAARVELKQSSGFTALDEAALQAVRGWEFEPARIGSIGIESEIEVPVRFKLTD